MWKLCVRIVEKSQGKCQIDKSENEESDGCQDILDEIIQKLLLRLETIFCNAGSQ